MDVQRIWIHSLIQIGLNWLLFSAVLITRTVVGSSPKPPPMLVDTSASMWVCGSKRLGCHASEANLRVTKVRKHTRDPPWLWNPGQTSPKVQNRDISGLTKMTRAFQKFCKINKNWLLYLFFLIIYHLHLQTCIHAQALWNPRQPACTLYHNKMCPLHAVAPDKNSEAESYSHTLTYYIFLWIMEGMLFMILKKN